MCMRVPGPVDELLASHRILTGSRRDIGTLPANQDVVKSRHADRQTMLLVYTMAPVIDPSWPVEDIMLEDVVLAYVGQARDARASSRSGTVVVQ